jgi:hypothetical protein
MLAQQIANLSALAGCGKTEIRGDFPVAIEFSAGGEVEYGDPEAIY